MTNGVEYDYLGSPKVAKIEYKKAGFWRRFFAFCVDALITGFVGVVVSVFLPIVGAIVTLLIPIFYYGFFYSKYSSSPGKMLLGMKVVRTKTGEKPDYTDALMRDLIGKLISSVLLGVGFLMVAFRKDKQALHDIFAKTTVIVKT